MLLCEFVVFFKNMFWCLTKMHYVNENGRVDYYMYEEGLRNGIDISSIINK